MKDSDIKDVCNEKIKKEFDNLWDISKFIYDNPELGFEEKKACKILTDYLIQKDFMVEIGIAGLPTAFKATYKKGNSNTRIAVFAEYDALPKLGHACGHNLIAASALGTAIAVKSALLKSELEGTIEIYGTPAEEDGGGKIILLNQGCFDGLDAVFLMHPTSAKTRIGGECISFSEYRIEYFGKSAQAESHPDNGINALDAASLFYSAVGMMRQQLKDGIHICSIISKAGEDIGQIPDYTQVDLEVSSMQSNDIESTKIKLKEIARGMGIATGCRMKFTEIPGYLGRIPNTTLANICKKELISLSEEVMEGLPSDKGGEDLGNVSRVIPICNLYTTLLPERKISGHTPEFKKLAISEAGKHCLKISSNAMARSIVELFIHPEYINEAKIELEKRSEVFLNE
ncbi:MAG: M20 family metallopeptidase [Erysipelotrichaceae bacterium]